MPDCTGCRNTQVLFMLTNYFGTINFCRMSQVPPYIYIYICNKVCIYLNCKVIQLFHCEQILLVEVVNICRQAQAIQPTVKENTYVHIQPLCLTSENTVEEVHNKSSIRLYSYIPLYYIQIITLK